MHKARWKLLRTNNDFIHGKTVYYTYISDTEYNAEMFAEDLLEAGIVIENVCCEGSSDTQTKDYPAQLFLIEYNRIKSEGMDYTVSCVWNGIPFKAVIANDEQGRPYNRIIISSQSLCFDANRLVFLLGKSEFRIQNL